MSALQTVSDAVIAPDDFFARDEATLRGAVAVAVLAVVVGLVNAFLVYRWMEPLLPPEFRGLFGGILLFAGVVGVPLIWLLVAGIAYGATALVDGSGSFGRTFRYVGWGFLPDVLVAPLTLGASVYLLYTVPRPEAGGIEGIQAAEAALYADPVMLLSGVVGVAVVCWNAYIWTYAVKHARNVSAAAGFASVLLPVLWLLWSSVSDLLGAL